MKTSLLFFSLIITYNIKTFAQATWQKTYSLGYISYSIQETKDSNYIFTGSSINGISLVKINPDGDTLWTKYYGLPNDVGYSVQQTSDSGFIITGWTTLTDPAYSDLYLIKTNLNGDTLWTKIYGMIGSTGNPLYDGGYAVKQTFDGGYIISAQLATGFPQTTLIKTNSTGDILWAKQLGSSGQGWYVCQTTDSGYIMVSYTQLIKNKKNGREK